MLNYPLQDEDEELVISFGEASRVRLDHFLGGQRDAPHRFEGVGGIDTGSVPRGFSFDAFSVEIGHGDADWVAARRAITKWQMFALPWVQLHPFRPAIEVGEMAVVGGSVAGFWFYGAARIIEVVDTKDTYGFTYATTDHMVDGEERFRVRKADDGTVFFDIDVFARPQRWYTWMAAPIFTSYRTRFRQQAGLRMRC